MKEQTDLISSKQKVILSDLAGRFVSQGATTSNILLHENCLSRPPSLEEALVISHFITHLLSLDFISSEQAFPLYKKIAETKKKDSNFYKKACPRGFYFSFLEGEKSLFSIISELIDEATSKWVGSKYNPLFGLNVWTTAPDKYWRLEQINKRPLPNYRAEERRYVSCFDLACPDFEPASLLFKALYFSLEGQKNMEIHKNLDNFHISTRNLDEAIEWVFVHEAIAKIDSQQVNIYLKKNHEFHLRVDILGTRPEILARLENLRVVLADFYSHEKEVSEGRTEFERLKQDYPLISNLPHFEKSYSSALNLNPLF